MFTISELNIFPIKSLGGYTVDSAEVTEKGFKYDRRWMIVDDQYKFLTQREFPVMALLVATIKNETMHVQHKNDPLSTLQVPLIPEQPIFKQVDIWSDNCKAQWVSKLADEWFSGMLKKNCHLVYMPDTTRRRVDGRYAFNKETTTFSDGYPYLIVGQESLKDLNTRLKEPLPMERFRPSIVFTGGVPYQEDSFKNLSIASIEFTGVKNCGRCMITTINQQTLQTGKEPLKTLATYRFKNNKIYFGRYLLNRGIGFIRKGEQLALY